MFSFFRGVTPSVCMCMLLSACSFTQASAIPLFNNGTGATLAEANTQPWPRQNIGDSGLSIEFPSALTVSRVGNKDSSSGLFTIAGTGTTMFAVMRPYDENGDAFDQLIIDLRKKPSLGCRVIGEDLSRMLDIDILRPYRCSVIETKAGTAYGVIGFSTASEVVDIASVMLFLGTDRMMMFDDLFTMEQISPDAQQQIADYFGRHPQVTQRWPDDHNVQALDKILRAILTDAFSRPSPQVSAANAFMRRVGESMEWEE